VRILFRGPAPGIALSDFMTVLDAEQPVVLAGNGRADLAEPLPQID
jgi:hypothetical protein